MFAHRALPLSLLLTLPLSAHAARGRAGQTPDAPASPAISQPQSGCTFAPLPDAPPAMCAPPASAEQNADNRSANHPDQVTAPSKIAKIDLVAPQGTALRIVIDRRTRISKSGETIRGTVAETVYAFDEPVIPAGSVAIGRVIKIDAVPAFRRAMAYSNGDLSPCRKYTVNFDTVILPDGRHLPVSTTVSAGTAQVVHLLTRSAQKQKSVSERATDSAKQEVKTKIHDAKDQLHQSWEQVSAPGRMQRLKNC